MNVYKINYYNTLNHHGINITSCEFMSDTIEELREKFPTGRIVSELIKSGFIKYNENLLIDIDGNYNSIFKSDILRLNYIKNYIIQQNRDNKIKILLDGYIQS